MNLYYFGADDTWENLQIKGFYRRNTCLLKAFASQDEIDHIFTVHRTTRPKMLKKLIKERKKEEKVGDVFFATVLPDINAFSQFNRWLIRLQIFWQTSYFSKPEDLLFAYWPKGYLAWKASRLHGCLVFDADHHLIEDPHLDPVEREDRIRLMNDIFLTADWIISGARSMLSWVKEQGFENTLRVRNGVDLDRFQGQKRKNRAISKSPVIGYLGTLSRWIDWDLFYQLIERNPFYLFHIVGQPHKSDEYARLMNFPNVRMYGHQTPEAVVNLLTEFDVGLVLYRKHPALDVDSMKIYEYLAAGVPVVSTRFHDYLEEDFKSLFYLGDSVEDLERGIKVALTKGFPDDGIRQAFLKVNDWLERVEEIIGLWEKTFSKNERHGRANT
jgi:glycosyltransferase involved in cell wall biosynthesis